MRKKPILKVKLFIRLFTPYNFIIHIKP